MPGPRPPASERRSGHGQIIAIVAAASSVVAAIVAIFMIPEIRYFILGLPSQDYPPESTTSVTPSMTSSVPPPATTTSILPSPKPQPNVSPVEVPVVIPPQCRGGTFRSGPVLMNPCIDVTAVESIDQLAMDVWLHDTNVNQGLRDTAHHCQATLTAGQTYRCEVRLIPPTPGHQYEAASGAKPGTASTIPSGGFVGTLSGDVMWPAP